MSKSLHKTNQPIILIFRNSQLNNHASPFSHIALDVRNPFPGQLNSATLPMSEWTE